ncbi:MAG: hypothetical protein IJJ15_07785 [Ruminococcus sp.]|nr:hypothetical protein [Ruminococcus sp.]
MKKKLLAVILVAAMLISLFAISTINSAAASQYAQTSTPVEGGNMLHCMCWSYNTIKANLDDIKAAGYTAVQTSCIQPPKDYNVYDSTKGNVWWHFYQPVDFCVADGNNWLGTKAELTSLCETAHEKGIKIIADVVANHMANPGSHGSYNGRSGEINETLLKDESCWHNTGTALSGSDRYDMVMHDNSNLPDLNTSSTKVQSMVLSMLKEAIDCGVDGFRFDAAQNIETPRDADNIKSMFWANTIGEANSYASSKGKTLFSYGEVYYDAWGGDNVLDDYIWYIGHVTEPNIGMEALGGVQGQDASRVAAVDYKNNRSASKNVLWVESHDSYYSGTGYGGTQTSSVNNSSVVRAWAIIASRADATALYFARPGNEYVTNATNDTTWKSTAVVEVNKFKNYFRGKSEYLSTSGKVAYNERGTNGVVISKLDGSGSVSLTAHTMASGTYTDQISGNTFTVSGGKITGTVGSTGVAVVYNPSNTSMTEATYASSGITLTLKPGVWNADGAWYAAYFYGNGETWKKMDGSGSTYTVEVPAGFTNVIFVRMNKNDTSTLSWDNKWNQTNDLTIPASNATYAISGWGSGTDVCPGTWTVDPTVAPTSAPTSAPTAAPTSSPETLDETTTPTTAPTAVPTTAPTTAPGSGYFLVGSFNNWTESSSYEFTLHNTSTNEYKLAGVTLHKNDEFKAKKGSTWYPSGNNLVVDQDGVYNVYFRPNGNGNSDWPSEYFYLSRKGDITEAPTDAPTAAPTAPPTDAPTSVPTEAPTQPVTDAPEESYRIGDADGDGEVSIMDVTKIQKVLATLEFDTDGKISIRGKVTLDDEDMNIMDATAIQKYLATLPVSDCRPINTITTY